MDLPIGKIERGQNGMEVYNSKEQAEDIAGLAIFLASKAGQFTVGETITCDGGLVASAGHDLTNE